MGFSGIYQLLSLVTGNEENQAAAFSKQMLNRKVGISLHVRSPSFNVSQRLGMAGSCQRHAIQK